MSTIEPQDLVNELLSYTITDSRISQIKKLITDIYVSKGGNILDKKYLKWCQALENRKVEHKNKTLSLDSQEDIVSICLILNQL